MHLPPPRTFDIHDAAGAVVCSFPMPILAQVEACVRLDLPVPGVMEDALSRHTRIIAQLLALTVPPGAPGDEQAAREAWLRTLQYHQLLDLHRKVMLWLQGVDFETQEEFEAALVAQKKSTPITPLSPEPKPSTDSNSSSSDSPTTSTPSPA